MTEADAVSELDETTTPRKIGAKLWLNQVFFSTTGSSAGSSDTRHFNPNHDYVVSEDIVLVFNRYEIHHKSSRTGKVTSETVVSETKDEVVVPKGTRVSLFQEPSKAPDGITIAAIFMEREQVTIKAGRNVIRRRLD